MTTTSSVAQQALILQLLQQQQLQQAADTRAATDAQAVAASTTKTAANATSAPSSINTTQQPQIAAPLSAVLSRLGSSEDTKSAHNDRHQQDRKVDQIVQSYSEQGPSGGTDIDSAIKPTA